MNQQMRQVPYEERNQTSKSKRRIKKLANDNGLEVELVQTLAGRFWNWDKENFSWVPKDQKNEMPDSAFTILEEGLSWPRDRVMEREELVGMAIDFVAAGMGPHIGSFVAAVPAQNNWAMSPLVTVAALRGLNSQRVSLCNVPATLDFDAVCSHAAAKCGLFARDHQDLSYAAFDSISMPSGEPPRANDGSWLNAVCDVIESLPPKSGLVDIIQATSGTLKGNKKSRARVLMALGIIGVLGTNEFKAGEDFWPEKRKLSSHFYSNEWDFPMNFWSESGHVVGAHILMNFFNQGDG